MVERRPNRRTPEGYVHEKREYPRIQIDSHVTCALEAGESFEGLAKDISLGGMYIEASVVPSFGTKISVACRLPGTQQEATLPAVVRWVKPDGFGIQFGLLGARETHAITQLLANRRQ